MRENNNILIHNHIILKHNHKNHNIVTQTHNILTHGNNNLTHYYTILRITDCYIVVWKAMARIQPQSISNPDSKQTSQCVFCVFIARVRTAPQVPQASLGRGGLWELLVSAGREACLDYLVPLCVGSVGFSF